MRSNPTKATRYIHQQADYTEQSRVSVDWDSAFSTVNISHPGDDDIFMQGDDADEFIAELDALCKRFPSLDEYTAALALAKPYVENIWG